jgi:hypothetical protein
VLPFSDNGVCTLVSLHTIYSNIMPSTSRSPKWLLTVYIILMSLDRFVSPDNLIFLHLMALIIFSMEARDSVMVDAQYCKPEGRGFDSP